MNSLRQVTRSSGKKCSLKEWASARQISGTWSLRQVMKAYDPPNLPGFADLHCHPASHMAFGADSDGNGGPFWGKPGLRLQDSCIENDLGPCQTDKHTGSTLDAVKDTSRAKIINQMEYLTPHLSHGWDTFEGWPNPSSLIHQQMHISMIYRAWQGGLRLMIASVTDNELINNLWNQGYNLKPSWPVPQANFAYDSAVRQLIFIQNLVNANKRRAETDPDWIQIVHNSTEAREAVSNNRLAVILGVEMDTLTAEQVIQLKAVYGVSQVVPIHLATNSFGGVALYDDKFNTNNWYLNGGQCWDMKGDHHSDLFFKVEEDSHLEFQLSRPQYLFMHTTDLSKVNDPDGTSLFESGALEPVDVSDSDYDYLGYGKTGLNGHRNPAGLSYPNNDSNDPDNDKPELFKLMKAGLIIDLAHMSHYSQAQALTLAEKYGYPLVNTHTCMSPKRREPLFSIPPDSETLWGLNYGPFPQKLYKQFEDIPGRPLKIPAYVIPIKLGTDEWQIVCDSSNDTGGLLELWYIVRLENGMLNVYPLSTTSERDIPKDLVNELTSQGGIIGTSTSGYRLYGEPLGDQIDQWIKDYYEIWNAMSFRGVALGTDMNGLSPNIPCCSKKVKYYDDDPSNPVKKDVMGTRSFDFTTDGLAHYGMLQDFIGALRQFDDQGLGPDIAEHFLMRTAEETIEMWEKVEQAAKGM